jgi:hypothetical protein
MKEETAIESELLVQDWKKDDIKFTEVEAVDIIKPEPLNPSDWRSDLGEMKRDEYGDPVEGPKISKKLRKEEIGMKNYLLQRNKAYDKKMDSLLYNKKSDKKKPDNLTKEEVKRDEYGDPVGGPKISKKQKEKNLASNTPDEQHTTTTSEAMNPAQQAAIAISKKQRIMDLMVAKKKKKSMKEENLDEKCWKGYEKKGMKTMFGKRYPNCVKKKIGESVSNWRDEIGYEGKDEVKKLSEDDMKGMSVKSGHKRPTKSGAGMTQKGVEAYRRRNPGSKLKTAVTTKPSKLKKGSKAANRRKSYCARSAGQMKKFPKAAKDPNSRLRQARRRWNC